MTIKAFRSGETARHWTEDCYKEKLTQDTDKIFFTLSMPSKGGGVTEVKLQVTSESFNAIARSMMIANATAAATAMASSGSHAWWSLILLSMMDANQGEAIRAVGRVLQHNEEAAVRACGTILLDKVGAKQP